MRTRSVLSGMLLVGVMVLLLPLQGASADTGPKPTMTFEFTQAFAGPAVTITSGSMLECQKADCSDGQPLKQLGPQHFSCTANSCDSLGYGYAPYERLKITFSDGKTRQSNVFQQAGFDSQYKVSIRPDDLLVEASFNLSAVSPLIYVLACVCLLGLGLVLVVALVVVVRRGIKKK